MDDPVFITSAFLIIGSPPALTLAQITSQSANGNSGFERLISKTICKSTFTLSNDSSQSHTLAYHTPTAGPITVVSYAILAAPTTVLLVLASLL